MFDVGRVCTKLAGRDAGKNVLLLTSSILNMFLLMVKHDDVSVMFLILLQKIKSLISQKMHHMKMLHQCLRRN